MLISFEIKSRFKGKLGAFLGEKNNFRKRTTFINS